MIRWQIGEVMDVLSSCPTLQELSVRVEGRTEKALSFPALIGPVRKGDRVLLNTTAVYLGLGTGGYHLVAQTVQRNGSDKPDVQPVSPLSSISGHIMKIRYTPYQIAVQSCEEENSPFHEIMKTASSLEGMPVLIGELHSMLPILVTGIKWFKKTQNWRIVYVMSDGAALPLAMSRHVQTLRSCDWIAGTITYGHAFGGDLEAVNLYSALLAARHILQADVAILMMGPGTVGTGTKWGFSGAEVAEMIHATFSLEGRPILVPRISFADRRSRHQGISHHQMTLIRQAIHVPFIYSVPPFQGREEEVIRGQLASICHSKVQLYRRSILEWDDLFALLEHYPGSEITVMGRTVRQDPAYFWGVLHGLAPLLD
ncbi:MAG: hypothetical protein BAA01_07865 [Bacillus thermozeamaize]|uniref:DUF3866 domain-containing protein n=1 Tax=Bacillus thermozeamaize TaxID=230954 RepID=A0A1Y3PBX5_9BACI|nr:MAG: hypothetical protein BAA01_07865 [Bacillus thermozeamaize]